MDTPTYKTTEARRIYLAAWREKNREKVRKSGREWAARNPEKVAQYNKTYLAANPAKRKEKYRKRYQRHKAEIQKRQREYYLQNRDRLLLRQRARRKAFLESFSSRSPEWKAKHRELGRATAKRWRERNPEKVKQMNARQRAKHRGTSHPAAIRWKKANIAHMRAYGKARRDALHPGYLASVLRVSRATVLSLPGLVETKQKHILAIRHIKEIEHAPTPHT